MKHSKRAISGSNALLTALKGAGKPHVHEMPQKKEPKHDQSPALAVADHYYPPTFYLSDSDFPGVCDMKSGETRTFVITAECTSKSTNERDGKENHDAGFTMKAISDITAAKG